MSLSNNVFERRTSTGSGLFSFFDDVFAQIFSQIASITVEKLRNTNFISSRHVKRENTSLPVDVRRSKTSLLKLPTTDKFCSLLCNRVYFDGFICLRAGTCGNSVKLFVLHRYCSMFWSKNSSRMDRRRRGINKALSSHE